MEKTVSLNSCSHNKSCSLCPSFPDICSPYEHNECIQYGKILLQYLKDNPKVAIDDDFTSKYIQFLTIDALREYYLNKEYSCINQIKKYSEVFEILFRRKYFPNSEAIALLVRFNSLFLIRMLYEYNFEFSSDHLSIALTIYPNKQIATFMTSICPLATQKNLNEAINSNYIECVHNILEQKVLPSEESLMKAIDISDEIFNMIFNNGVKLTDMCLYYACQNGSFAMVEKILQNGLAPKKEYFKYILKFGEECTNKFIEFGYDYDYNDVCLAIEYHFKIKGAETKIMFDEKFVGHCINHRFYPYKLNPILSSLLLENLCEDPSNLNHIKQLVKNGALVTQKCLENACKNKKNTKIIKFLLSKGLKPNKNCVKISVSKYPSSSLSLIVTEFLK
jgi:hypothetical protein